jgi:hypothetical protein
MRNLYFPFIVQSERIYSTPLCVQYNIYCTYTVQYIIQIALKLSVLSVYWAISMLGCVAM